MRRIQLPNTDLHVSQLVYGVGSFDGSFPTEDGLKLIAKYVDAGGNFLDTAHCYCFWVKGGDGASERFVGAAVKEFGRENLVVSTKGGHIGMDGYPRPDSFLAPDLVRRDLDDSLERLGISSIDIYYLHRDDPRVPVSEIIDALNEHTASGRVRHLGASNWSVARYLEASQYAALKKVQPFVVLQNQWSLAQPNWTNLASPGAMLYIESADRQNLIDHNIPVAAYSSTANGYFATKGERGGGFESDQARKSLSAAEQLAKKRGVTPNQVALAYLLNQPSIVLPVLGTRDESHLTDALGATDVVLSPEELQFLGG
jgi:aryl-alcohol dehydrogenase-like predicted oxidoreductase